MKFSHIAAVVVASVGMFAGAQDIVSFKGYKGAEIKVNKPNTLYIFTPAMIQAEFSKNAKVSEDTKSFSMEVTKTATIRFFGLLKPEDFAALLGKKLAITMTVSAAKPMSAKVFYEGNLPESADKDAHFWRAKEIQLTEKPQTIVYEETLPAKGVVKNIYVRFDVPEANTLTFGDVTMTTVEAK